MVQIEELGKVIAQLMTQRDADATRRIHEQIQVVYDSLKLNSDYLLTAVPDDIRKLLDHEDSGGILRMKIAIKALIEESFHVEPEERKRRLLRAKELLEYLQKTDITFSFERINQLSEIEQWLLHL